MKDRIKKFMDYKGISAGELSVLLEVQRSNISHILNGRNKPGALFIEKLLLVFPELNARWLLTGQGDMVESTQNATQEVSANSLREETTKDKPGETTLIEQAKEDIAVKEVPVKEVNTIKTDVEIEKMVLLYSDGTFTTYKQREDKE